MPCSTWLSARLGAACYSIANTEKKTALGLATVVLNVPRFWLWATCLALQSLMTTKGGTQELENSHFQKCTHDTEYFMGFQNCFRHIPHKTLLIIQFRCKCLVFWHGPHQYAFTSWCHYSPRILTSYIASHVVHNLLSSTPLPKISISNYL